MYFPHRKAKKPFLILSERLEKSETTELQKGMKTVVWFTRQKGEHVQYMEPGSFPLALLKGHHTTL